MQSRPSYRTALPRVVTRLGLSVRTVAPAPRPHRSADLEHPASTPPPSLHSPSASPGHTGIRETQTGQVCARHRAIGLPVCDIIAPGF
jgi:hypothetical protein